MPSLRAILFVLLLLAAVPAGAAGPKIGDQIVDLRFKDIRYLPRSLRDLGDHKAYVFVFTNTSCPIVQKSWPRLVRLYDDFRERGVEFVSINVGPDDEIAAIAQQGVDFEIPFPMVKDSDGSCTTGLGARRTPEVVVLDHERRLRYRGRIDDQLRLGGARPQATREDLRLALEDVLAGRDVAIAETPVDGCLITPPEVAPPAEGVTFAEHIAPLFQKHCQECHRPSGGAPFSLLTFDEVRSQSEMIAEVVADRRMPPWYASREQHFANERGLSKVERRQIAAWVRAGCPGGDESKAPKPLTFPSETKWEIGDPDLVITAIETHSLPADGFVDYRYIVLPHFFLQETWISAAEILPSNPAVVHHCNLGYFAIGKEFDDSNFITGRVPGGTAMKLDDGLALRIPAGSVVGLQVHYTTTGKPEKNRMSVGFRFPQKPVKKELHHLQVTTSRYAIPPGAGAHPVASSRTLPCDASGVGMFAHMHLRGKDMTFVAHPPEGSAEQPSKDPERLLSIPNYHYDWQQNYRWEPGVKKFAKGTRIEVTAHFDNSAFNPFNPDATVTVTNGPQTVNEMMFGFFFYTDDGEELDLRVDPKTGHVWPAKRS